MHFSWIVSGPFHIEPIEGHVASGQSLQSKVYFRPMDAAAVTIHAGCQIQGGDIQVMHVSGVGKFPYLSLEYQSVDFGSVLVGQSHERTIRFANHSNVNAHFSFTYTGTVQDGVFFLSPTKGTLPPENFSDLIVSYTPKHTGTFSCEDWVLSTPGGNKVTLTLRGLATSPEVSFSSRSFNFASVAVGQTASRVLYMHNQSQVPVAFEFQAELIDLFSFSKVRGMIPADTAIHITITFRPQVPSNVWRRVVCIVKDADPVGVDLVGTSYDDKTRPPPLTQQHINTYLSRVLAALPSHAANRNGLAQVFQPGAKHASILDASANPQPTALSAQQLVGPDAWDLYFNGMDPMHAVVVDADVLDFGTCSRLSSPEYKQVVVTNNTDVKVLAFVAVPAWQDPSFQDQPQPVFQVIPEQQEIKPQSQAIFRVAFRPSRDAQFYCQTLHVSATMKIMRNFRLVSDEQIVPPWTVPITVGIQFHPCNSKPVTTRATVVFNNTAMNAAEIVLKGTAYLPKLTFDGGKSSLYFRPTCVGASSQRSFTLHNRCRIPVSFMFALPQDLHGIVDVTPVGGILRGNESCSTLWTFIPKLQKVYQHSVTCVVQSAEGMHGNYAYSTQLRAPADEHQQELTLQVVGEGTVGAVAVEPPSLDLGHVKVGYAVKRTVRLLNRSDGVLRYTIECHMGAGEEHSMEPVTFRSSGLVEEQAPKHLEFWVEEPEGTLAAKASKTITITVLPRYRKHYHLHMNVKSATINQLAAPQLSHDPSLILWSSLGFTSQGAINRLELDTKACGPPSTVVTVEVVAAFPAVRVTDVQCRGMPKHVLWQMLGIEQLNQEFMSVVTPTELHLDELDDQGELSNDIACSALHPYPLMVGMLALGSTPRTIYMELSNITKMPVHWELHSYDDPEMETENWVRPGAPATKDEKLRAFIVENRILEVKPRSGTLDAGSSVVVSFTYTPSSLGQHQLPIFFHAQDGKRIYMDLSGITVPPHHPHLSILPLDRNFVLEPVALGDSQPPMQMYTLRNYSPGPMSYVLDLSMLSRLQEESYGFPVLQCCSSVIGEIPVDGVAKINFLFHPAEARVYQTQIGIRLGHGQDEVVTIIGRGLNPRDEGSSQHWPSEMKPRWERWHSFALCPRIDLPGQLASINQDMLVLEPTIVKGVSKSLLVLTNVRPYPIFFNWDLGVFGWLGRAVEGNLTIQPAAGSIKAHGVVVCQLSFEAGLKPQLFSGELTCVVEVDTSTHTWQAPHVAGDGSVTQDQSEEHHVLAQDPPAPKKIHKKGRLLKNRLPVHLSSTVAIRNRLAPIKERHTNIEISAARVRLDTQHGPVAPAPHPITVTLAGRVLTEQQIKAGYFTMPWSKEEAWSLGKGGTWVPPSSHPFWMMKAREDHSPAATQTKGLRFDEVGPDVSVVDPGLHVAGEALKDILADVLNDAGVIQALDSLEEESIPVLAEIHPALPQIFKMRSLEAIREQANAQILNLNSSQITADVDVTRYFAPPQAAQQPAGTILQHSQEPSKDMTCAAEPELAYCIEITDAVTAAPAQSAPAAQGPARAPAPIDTDITPCVSTTSILDVRHTDTPDSSDATITSPALQAEARHSSSPAPPDPAGTDCPTGAHSITDATPAACDTPEAEYSIQHPPPADTDTHPTTEPRSSSANIPKHEHSDPFDHAAAVVPQQSNPESSRSMPSILLQQASIAAAAPDTDPLQHTTSAPDDAPITHTCSAQISGRNSMGTIDQVDIVPDHESLVSSLNAEPGSMQPANDDVDFTSRVLGLDADLPGTCDVAPLTRAHQGGQGNGITPVDEHSSLSLASRKSSGTVKVDNSWEDLDVSGVCGNEQLGVEKLKRLLGKRPALAAALKQPGYLSFAEFVVDKVLVGLMQESVLGDWVLHK